MAERRVMGAALAISPEKLAFIQGASGDTKSEPPPARRQTPPPATTDSVAEPQEAAPKRSRRRPVAPDRHSPTPKARPFISQILIPLTTRLQPDTASALRRACLEQKLAGRQPATQQEIVEAAVHAWLTAESYL